MSVRHSAVTTERVAPPVVSCGGEHEDCGIREVLDRIGDK